MNPVNLLSSDEIKYFSSKSDWRALQIIVFNWTTIALLFAITAYWTNPLVIVVAIVFLGGRQLSLAVIIHDCGHGSMFTRSKHNRFAARWLAEVFIFSDAAAYRKKHAKHHLLGGSRQDPDLQNYVNYAVSGESFKRKVIRDLSGRTGIKTLISNTKQFGAGRITGWIGGQLLLWAILFATGHGLLYLLWPTAWLTTHMLIVRIRNAAEHGAVADLFDPDPRRHTRTTIPRWWERLLFAPNNVNYHIEHHILPSVPCYRLPEFHAFLDKKGHLDQAQICHGYWQVLQQLIQRKPAISPS